MINPFDDNYFMKQAFQEAQQAFDLGEIPVGAVVVANNQIIARAHNLTEQLTDVTAHAEMLAITAAANSLGGKYLHGCTLYVTLEPCCMCAGALYWSQIDKIVYAARDEKRGACKVHPSLFHPKTLVTNGVMEAECGELLKTFFVAKRQKMNSLNSRIYGLDVFRAVAILFVLLAHGKGLSGDVFSFFPDFPLIDGVELFFVLSGFLIGGILISTVEQQQKFDIKSLFNFWKRRWFRTLPTYYLVLIINIILTKTGLISGDIHQFNYRFFIFCQNFSTGFYEFFWESWSLSVEEWFYISLPILILVLSRILSIKKTIFVAITILLLLPLFYRISISDLKVDQFWWGVEFRKVVLTRLDAINYGVLAAYCKFYYPIFWFKCRKWAFVSGLILLYITILLPIDYNSIFFKTIYFNMFAIGAMLLLPLADSIKTYKNRHIGKFFTFFSKISYSLYLINLGIVITLITTNFKLQTNLQHVVAYGSYWLIVVVLAWIIYTYFENPIMKLRDKF